MVVMMVKVMVMMRRMVVRVVEVVMVITDSSGKHLSL